MSRNTTEAVAIFLIAMALFIVALFAAVNTMRARVAEPMRVRQICYVYTDGRPTECRPEMA